MKVEGMGTEKLKIQGITQVIRRVYYIPELKSNLISIGQLQEKGHLKVKFEDNMIKSK